MKKSYEKSEFIIFSIIVFFIIIIFFGVFLINEKVVLYEKFSGIVSSKDILEFVLSNDETKLFQKNKVLYINNKKRKFDILKIDTEVLKREGEVYNYVFVKVDISDLLKVNDIVEVSIMNKSVKSYNIFKIIWEGDSN